MKQVLQNLRSGETVLQDLPAPVCPPGHVLVQTRASLISAGTERMLVEFSRASLLQKARSQPDKVRQVLDKIRTDGLLPTLEAVFSRLDEPIPLGYSGAGVVREAGRGVAEFHPGDRVVSNGPHADLVAVPKNLCAAIPDAVTDEQAAFTVLSAIALQGIRLLNPAFGERVVVYGLGLIGLVTVQLLQAAGCDVMGIDLNAERLALAERWGARTVHPAAGGDPVTAAAAWTEGKGVDGVLITAAAKDDEIVHHAARMCRKRGRLVLVGVVGLNLRREDFYEKELAFQVSCSYGPGRYDDSFERGGRDYPFGFVRWTEQRNFQAVLRAIETGRLRVDDLITHRVPFDQAPEAYRIVGGDPHALGVVLTYPAEAGRAAALTLREPVAPPAGRCTVGVIGAGNFSKRTLMPALAKAPARIRYVADLDAAAAGHVARKFGVEQAVTDYHAILQDPDVEAVFIAVGHHLHARFVCETLEAGKHAFVEKPLALTADELRRVLRAHRAAGDRLLMVGFNRRFSPHTAKLSQALAGRSEPLAMTMTVNAGAIPPEHWVQDPARGGGRIVGEACHFIDLMVHLAGSPVRTVAAAMMGRGVATRDDKMAIVLGFHDGSVGTVNYFANGARAYPKERLEVFSEGRVFCLDNFRRLTGHGTRGLRRYKTWRQDKGHAAEVAAFARRVAEGGEPLIPVRDLVNVTLASFAAMTAAAEECTIDLARTYGDLLSDTDTDA